MPAPWKRKTTPPPPGPPPGMGLPSSPTVPMARPQTRPEVRPGESSTRGGAFGTGTVGTLTTVPERPVPDRPLPPVVVWTPPPETDAWTLQQRGAVSEREARILSEVLVPSLEYYACVLAGLPPSRPTGAVLYDGRIEALRRSLVDRWRRSALISPGMLATAWWCLEDWQRAALAVYARTGMSSPRSYAGGK